MPKFNHCFDIYSDVFRPPTGYQTDFAELTTYSLSKHFLTTIPAMIYAGNHDIENPGEQALNDILRSTDFIDDGYSNKFHIFYDGNVKTLADSEDFDRKALRRYATCLLYSSCTPVKLDKDGLFHPKLILLQFSKKSDEKPVEGPAVKFRLVVSSRNLTWANYFEAGVILEGEPGSEGSRQVGGALYGFFQNYYKFETDKTRSALNGRINWDLLKNSAFRVTGPGITAGEIDPESVELFFGRDSRDTLLTRINNEATQEGYDNCHAISMNPTDDLLKVKKQISDDKFSNNTHYICNFKDIYELNDNGDYWVRKKALKEKEKYFRFVIPQDDAGLLKPIPIHAKVYLLWNSADKSSYSVWAGSANCSTNGLGGGNEEALLHMMVTAADKEPPTTNIVREFGVFKTVGKGGTYKYDPDNLFYQAGHVQVTECENEFPTLKCEIVHASYEEGGTPQKETVTVTFSLHNGEKEPVTILGWPRALSETEIPANTTGTVTRTFRKTSFTNTVQVQKGSQIFELLLPIDYMGEEMDKILQSLPREVPPSVAELIPNPPNGKATDSAYGRLRLHRMYSDDETYRKTLDTVKEKIMFYKERRKTIENLYMSLLGSKEEDALLDEFSDTLYEEWESICHLDKCGMDILLDWIPDDPERTSDEQQ